MPAARIGNTNRMTFDGPSHALGPRPTNEQARHDPLRVLQAWLAIEILSPPIEKSWNEYAAERKGRPTYRRAAIPWDAALEGRTCDPDLRHLVVLAGLDAAEAMRRVDAILASADDESGEEINRARGHIVAAAVLVGDDGLLVEGTSAVAAFAWGFGRLVRDGANGVIRFPAWPDAEQGLARTIEERLTPRDDRGRKVPLRPHDLASIAEWLRSELGVPTDVWTTLPVVVTSRGRPDTAAQGEILGTMLVPDLCRVIADVGLLGRAAADYLGVTPPAAWWNALAVGNRPRLADVVAPKRFPLGRWPGPGRHPLTLLQQSAVNAIVERLEQQGLAAVNGPPGTGKTTLLRDLIAHVLVERAALLAAIGDPNAAVRKGAAGLGFDPMDTAIVVASSNNAAVENVTTEVPLRGAIAEDLREPSGAMDLFAEVADLALGVAADAPPEKRAWGLAAAKMGKSKNRSDFLGAFWFDKERSIRVRLKAAAAAPDRSRWTAARERFASAYAEVARLRDRLQDGWEGERDLAAAAAQLRALEDADRRPLRAGMVLAGARAALFAPRGPRPPWWQRLLYIHSAARRHRREMAALAAAVRAAAEACPGEDAEALRPKHLRRVVLSARAVATAPLWGESDDTLRRASPWNDGEFRRARDDLFVAAIALHREFILAAAAAMLDELGDAVDVLNGKRSSSYRKRSSGGSDPARALGFFFLACPVVSTTFASMGRMFRELGRESIGWLLIDEAGQATPQAAIGAVWRARRAVVVGDPLQIPPVVPHPPSMSARVFGLFGEDPEGWAAPADSAQTLADRRSPVGAVFGEGKRATRVGMPLLVHRRCDAAREAPNGTAERAAPAHPERHFVGCVDAVQRGGTVVRHRPRAGASRGWRPARAEAGGSVGADVVAPYHTAALRF